MSFDGFDDHDGVVHHQPNGQHQAKQRQRVDGKAQQRKHGEGANQRHRHSQQRNQAGPPALQEHINHQHHQHQRFQESLGDFPNAFAHRSCGVERDDIIEVGWETLLQLGHALLDGGGGFEGVGAGQLIQGHDGRGLAVEPADDVVVLRPQFHPGDVSQPHQRPVRIGAQDDFTKLLLRLQAALRAHRISEFLSRRHWMAADAPGRVDGVLVVHGANDLRNGDVQRG